ncbi:hypothetical protein ACHAXT_003974 [Thalassiosira profunda]
MPPRARALLAFLLGTATSQALLHCALMGAGRPLDGEAPGGVHSYVEHNIGRARDKDACLSRCRNIASPSLPLRGFSFYEDDAEGSGGVCRCWVGGSGEIASTDGAEGGGDTYGCCSEGKMNEAPFQRQGMSRRPSARQPDSSPRERSLLEEILERRPSGKPPKRIDESARVEIAAGNHRSMSSGSSRPRTSTVPSSQTSSHNSNSDLPPRNLMSSPTPLETLDEAILTDLLQQYDTYIGSTSCSAPEGATSFSFDWPGTRAESQWYEGNVPKEEAMFQAEMTYADTSGDRSWSLRFGTSGDLYSIFVPDMWGETIGPQSGDDAPWVDEVQQSVALVREYNRNPQYQQFCPGPEIRNDDECKRMYIHQAGAYQRDEPYTDVPFYSPSLAKHCSGNSCLFASWGTHAHVATPFTSPLIYINKFTNCGDGIIEHTQIIHNFADPNNPDGNPNFARDTDYTYFNVGWSNVRTSTLPVALEPGARNVYADTSSLAYEDPDTTDEVEVCTFGEDGRRDGGLSDAEFPEWAGERTNIRWLGGYTAFVEDGFVTNLPPLPLPCRKPASEGGNCAANPITCWVRTCTDEQVASEGYVRYRLRVAPNSSPKCAAHTPGDKPDKGYFGLQCDFADTGFGTINAGINSFPCAPGAGLSFLNTRTSYELPVAVIRNWSFDSRPRVFFSVKADSAEDAIDLVNARFDNTDNAAELLIEAQGKRLAKSEPYDPSALNAFTFVYGKGEAYETMEGEGRRRLGTGKRDYTVFTPNWWRFTVGNGLQAGSTYTNRGYYFISNLGSVEATAESLLSDIAIDEIGLEEWTPRLVNIYATGQTFIVKAALTAGGTTTTCDSAAKLACAGASTPQANRVPFFYMTCGPQTYFGPNPYHFTPEFAATFPGHSGIDNPVRSYLCDGLDSSIRPTWKMMGFFDPTDAGCIALASSTFDETVCDGEPTQQPTGTPTKQPMEQPSREPSASEQPPTPKPTDSPSLKSAKAKKKKRGKANVKTGNARRKKGKSGKSGKGAKKCKGKLCNRKRVRPHAPKETVDATTTQRYNNATRRRRRDRRPGGVGGGRDGDDAQS